MEFPLLGQQVSVELANTLWFSAGRTIDALETTGGAARWLAAVGERQLSDGSTLADATLEQGVDEQGVDEELRAGLQRLRGAVRSLFGAHATGGPVDAGAIEQLNRAAAAAPSWLHARLAGDHAHVVRRRPPDAAGAILAALAEDALAVAADAGVAARLTACPCPGCLALFVQDDPRRRFCSPICGTRTRVARHYARQKRGKGG